MNRKPLAALAGICIVSAALLAPSTTLAKGRPAGGSVLNIVGYSTPGPVYINGLEPAFQATSAGRSVTFTNSFHASDSQSAAVLSGQKADVVNFSYEPNMALLQQHNLVPKNWAKNKYNGIVTDSYVAFGVRPGNPKKIKGWSDLTRSGIGVVTPDTAVSGSAKWNILAGYGATYLTAKWSKKARDAAGQKYLKALFKNIVAQPTSGSATTAAFLAGTGDVMIGYEDDILEAQGANPGKIQLVVPPQSELIQNPLSVTLPPAAQNQSAAANFVKFLYSNAGQTIWAQSDYIPVVPAVAKHYHFAKPKKLLFTVSQLGGWGKLDPRFFDPTSGIWTKIKNG